MAAQAGHAHGRARTEHGHAHRGAFFVGTGERHRNRFRYGRALAFSCIALAAALVISMKESFRLPSTSSSSRSSSGARLPRRGLAQRVEHVDQLARAFQVEHGLAGARIRVSAQQHGGILRHEIDEHLDSARRLGHFGFGHGLRRAGFGLLSRLSARRFRLLRAGRRKSSARTPRSVRFPACAAPRERPRREFRLRY